MTLETFNGIRWEDDVTPKVTLFEPGQSFDIGGVTVSTIAVPHDVECVAYKLESGDESMVLATDLGHIPPDVETFLRGAKTICLESNYSQAMIEVHEYAEQLKFRISGPRGHLSIESTCEFLAGDLTGTEEVILCHLSSGTILIELAELMAKDAIAGRCNFKIAKPEGGFI